MPGAAKGIHAYIMDVLDGGHVDVGKCSLNGSSEDCGGQIQSAQEKGELDLDATCYHLV